MTQTVSKYLGIYLNDHHAAAIGGLELVKRSAGEHQGTELGDFLAGLRDEIEADHAALRAIMDELGVGVDRPKEAVAWVAEKAGRLKLNGQLTGSSPLTPLVELEGLSLGIEGKRLGWIALAEAAGDVIGRERLDELIARAERQGAGVEERRRIAARQAASA